MRLGEFFKKKIIWCYTFHSLKVIFRCLILDEADRLLDMGYEKDVSR